MDLDSIADRLHSLFPGSVKGIEREHVGDAFLVLDPARLVEVCMHLRDDPQMRYEWLMCLSGVDYPPETIAVVYHLYSQTHGCKLVLKVLLARSEPRVPSIESVWKMANFHERECYDMFGVVFEGHPDLRRILLPEDWEGHPLRKDYVYPESYRGVTNKA